MEEIEIYTSMNEIEIIQVQEILKENNIPYIRKDNGVGAYLNIYMGQSMQEKSIYVSQEDSQKAIQLIQNMTNFAEREEEKQPEDEEIEEEEQEKKEDRSYKKHIYAKRMIAGYVLGLPIFIILIFIIVAMFQN